MLESSFGKNLRVTIGGGSHEPAVYVEIKGLTEELTSRLPEGRPDMNELQAFLDRRAPGGSDLVSPRKEQDVPVLIEDAHSLKFEIPNTDVRSADYDTFRNVPRPGHADYTGRLRYGEEVNMAGGGPFSGRMTVGLCVAGGIAMQILESCGISISAEIDSIGGIDELTPDQIESIIRKVQNAGDSVGAVIECRAEGLPAGIGGSMYDGLESVLSPILFGIPAVKGVEFGAGFGAADMLGSENNDAFYYGPDGKTVVTRTNNCGGILGGISNGMPLVVRVAFKPTPSIAAVQDSVNLATGMAEQVSTTGRHDPCVALRALPCVESAVALGLLDAMMEQGFFTKEKATGIDACRSDINRIDSEIVDLLRQRMARSAEIGKTKEKAGLPVLDEAREAQVLSGVSARAGAELAPAVQDIYRSIMKASREVQSEGNLNATRPVQAKPAQYGLLGASLPHSYSKDVHEAIGEYSFDLLAMNPDELDRFISADEFKGLSVTIPYKQTVIKYCKRISSLAARIGAVNTLYHKDGELIGHNTDYEGFLYAATRAGLDFKDKRVLVLGSGGTCRTVCTAAKDGGAARILIASRNPMAAQRKLATPGSVNLKSSKWDVVSYRDAVSLSSYVDIIINTTPVGTYPNNPERLINLEDFPRCSGVIDVIYNPSRTGLLLDAERLGIRCTGGLPMLVAQATAAAGFFMGKPGAYSHLNEELIRRLEGEKNNIILVGMPGCGKSTIGRYLSKVMKMPFADTDEVVLSDFIEEEFDNCVELNAPTIEDIFESEGEAGFRRREAVVARRLGSEHGRIIATGGGILTTPGNLDALRQNGVIVHLTRPVHELATEGRPLSSGVSDIKKMAAQRLPQFEAAANITLDSSSALNILSQFVRSEQR